MQTEKTIVAMVLILIGLFLIDFAFLKFSKKSSCCESNASVSLLSVFVSVVFGVFIVYLIKVV